MAPEYAWGIVRGAMIAVALGIEEISVIEFGVAEGNGLIAMDSVAQEVESIFGIGCAVVGFDTGKGMPPAVDHRDAPFAVREGQFAMDAQKLRSRLQRAELKLGPLGDTVEVHASPVGVPQAVAGDDVRR